MVEETIHNTEPKMFLYLSRIAATPCKAPQDPDSKVTSTMNKEEVGEEDQDRGPFPRRLPPWSQHIPKHLVWCVFRLDLTLHPMSLQFLISSLFHFILFVFVLFIFARCYFVIRPVSVSTSNGKQRFPKGPRR